MYVVVCPECGARVEIPQDAVGRSRTDPWNVVGCDECPATFDYDDEDVIEVPDDKASDTTPPCTD